jgi:predicted O-methyltransferase YrrM
MKSSFRSALLEAAKRIAFRSRLLNRFSRPDYPYGIEPIQLAWLCQAIEDTRSQGGSGHIVEVGVARGMTSFWLCTHLAMQNDPRTFAAIDTFSGFTKDDVSHEVTERGKRREDLRGFAYNDARIYASNLRRSGHPRISVHESDVAEFDWKRVAPIDVMLLDVDLYAPTRAVLERALPCLSAAARIMVDDCRPGTAYDGANQAYEEFCAAHKVAATRIGRRAGVIRFSNGRPCDG